MVRSWAYILMIAATLAGVVALVWPSPEVQTIEEIAMPARAPAPRAEAPQKPAKAAAKAAQPAKKEAAPPAAPAVVKDMPAPNTTTKRQYSKPDNGMQPSPFSRTGSESATGRPAEPPKPANPSAPHGAPPRPPMPFKPGATPGSHQPAKK
jgi:hypothetical protein